MPGDWHLVHLGQFAQSGPGLIIAEATTGVEPQGRITLGCTGLYSDASEDAFARIIRFVRSVGDSRVGIQLSHAGRKGQHHRPVGRRRADRNGRLGNENAPRPCLSARLARTPRA